MSMRYGLELKEKEGTEMLDCFSWEQAEGFIYPMLLPYEKNKKLLRDFVYHPFLDLIIVYYIRIPGKERRIIITERMRKRWEVSKERLKEQAKENLKTDGYETLIASKMAADLLYGQSHQEKGVNLAILSNCVGSYGAAGILYLPLLRDYADWMQCNLFLLPSSIHEWIILPDDGSYKVEDLKLVVEEMNQECVSVKAYLSDRVYCYDREKNEVVIAA